MPSMLVLAESHQIDALFSPAPGDGHDLVGKQGVSAGFGNVWQAQWCFVRQLDAN